MSPTRLLPEATSPDMRDALEARVYDGLLMLGRQRQYAEHVADDAGSPAAAALEIEQAPLGDYRPGSGAGVPDVLGAAPLEATVESEPLEALANRDFGLRIEAAHHFLRLLEAHGAGDCREPYRAAYAWSIPSAQLTELDAESQATLAFVAGRVPDPVRLAADLGAALGPSGQAPGELPAVPALPANQRAAAQAAARMWLAWLGGQGRDRSPTGDSVAASWQPDRLEYAFAASARRGESGLSLQVPEYGGGRLDWHSFRLGPNVGANQLPAAETHGVATLPAPVAFRGMPADRFWRFEDARVNWDAVSVESSAVATALLLEFALVSSPDWFVVPVELDVGRLARIRSLVVRDTFDERVRIRHVSAVDGPATPWRLFALSPQPGVEPDDAAFLLPPVAGVVLGSDPIEDVALLRDEAANLAWAVERLVESPCGGVLDRYEEYQERLAAIPEPPPGHAASPRYRLGSDVPHYWIPLVPEPAVPPAPSMRLRRAAIARPDVPPGPSGRLMRSTSVLRTEEVPREGAHVTRTYRYARWIDGSTHLWVSRRKEPGRGEGSSGLRFDYLEQADSTGAAPPTHTPPTPGSGFAGAVLADGPLAYYRLGEHTGASHAMDASSNDNHGTLSATGITLVVAGLGAGDTAARFDGAGDTRITVADRAALSPRHLTMEALVAWSGQSGGIQQRILEKSTTSDGVLAAYGLSVLDDGRVRVELSTADSTPFVTSTVALQPHAATHLAATYDGTTAALYIDGQLDTRQAATGDIVATAGLTALGIGNQAEPTRPRAFNGVIDEVALYDKALSAARLRAHADAVAANLGNLLRNPDFALARPGPPPPLTGSGTGALAAAKDWTLWNNPAATTATDLQLTTRPGSSGTMLHLTTTAGSCGLVQQWAPNDTGPIEAIASAWVYVVRGTIGLGSGNGGNTGIDVTNTARGRWELLQAPSGRSPVNELIVYAAAEDGAEFYVDSVSVRAVPEPATFASQSVPTAVTAGQPFDVTVTMRNTGSETWTPDALHRLGSQNPQDNLTWGLGRVELPGPTAPGHDAAFHFQATAPPDPGTYHFQWRMLQEGVAWFGQHSPNIPIHVKAPRDAEFISQSVPTLVTAGQPFDVTVTMRNTGTETWTPEALHRLGSQNPQDNLTWGLGRVELPGPTAPGHDAVFHFQATAPPDPGTYHFQWRMLQEGVAWFGQHTTSTAIVGQGL